MPGNDKEHLLQIVNSSPAWLPPPSDAVVKERQKKTEEAVDAAEAAAPVSGRGAERLIPMLEGCPLYVEDSAAGYILLHDRLYRLDPDDRELKEDLIYYYYSVIGKTLSRMPQAPP